MKNKGPLGILALFLVIGAALVFMKSGSDHDHDRGPGSTSPTVATDAGPRADRTVLTLLYSTEKEEWLRSSVAEFSTSHPDIEVRLEAMGSLDAVRAILAGDKRPVLWSPSDSLAENLLATQWQIAHSRDPIVREGTTWPRPMLLSPLVFVLWESRARVLLGTSTDLRWLRIRDAVATRTGWVGLQGDAAWGFVKFGHTDPTRSNSGLQAITLMAYDFYNRQANLTVPDVTAAPFQDFVHQIEQGRQRQDFAAASTGTFIQNMIRQGPSLYDIAVVYEALAITSLPRAQGRWEHLRVLYPNINIWSDNPLCLFNTEWVSPAQRRAAGVLATFLMSQPVQQRALQYGYRPGNIDVPVITADPSNPFNRFRDMGIRSDVSRVAQAPDGAVLQALLQTYQRNVN